MVTPLPGGIGLSQLRVYTGNAADGLAGGTPHVHLACTEAYVVVEGSGSVQTLTLSGFRETPLEPGAVVWFTPGTIHRLVNGDGGLQIVVIMQNSGLPEAGDAVFPFPPGILADRDAYARAAALPTGEASAEELESAVRKRRDLALSGFARLREEGAGSLEEFYRSAARLAAPEIDRWSKIWREGAAAATADTSRSLDLLRDARTDHLAQAALSRTIPTSRWGMCGWLEAHGHL